MRWIYKIDKNNETENYLSCATLMITGENTSDKLFYAWRI